MGNARITRIIAIPKTESMSLPGVFTKFPVRNRVAVCYDLVLCSEERLDEMVRTFINPLLANGFCSLGDQGYLPRYGYCASWHSDPKGLSKAPTKVYGDLNFLDDDAHVIEINYLSGVNDNRTNVAKELALSLTNRRNKSQNAEIYSTSTLYMLDGLSDEQLNIIKKAIYNPIVNIIIECSGAQFKSIYTVRSADFFIKDNINKPDISADRHSSVRPSTPATLIEPEEIDLNINDDELLKLSDTRAWSLSLEDIHAVRDHFNKVGRKPKDIDLEFIAQSWSEHCKHRIFNAPIDDIDEGIFKRYIRGATEKIRAEQGADKDFCISVFTDNSGAIVFDDEYLITHKVETHNSPSAIEPYGGAMTGILGVNRDCLGFGMGAEPIANIYAFCFAAPCADEIYRDKERKQQILDPHKIIHDVVSGIEAGGNCSGIPTPHGLIYYDPSYRGKPLVYAGTIGMIPRIVNGKPSHKTGAQDGDLIVILGNSTGRDGVHGATLSSGAADERNDVNMVQIGNPYLQKKVMDAVFEMRHLFNAITDNGAGGLSSSVGEMGHRGFEVDISSVRTHSSMYPWQTWVSESQERMTLAVPPANIDLLCEIATEHDVKFYVIGEFNSSGRGIIRRNKATQTAPGLFEWRYTGNSEYDYEILMDMDLNFLSEGCPRIPLKTSPGIECDTTSPCIEDSRTVSEILLEMLSSPNLRSREQVVRRYDHTVQGNAVLGPIQGIGEVCGDASIIRPMMQSESMRGIAITSSMTPSYGTPTGDDDRYFDTYHMAACAVDSAVRNLVAVGANPARIALLDNFCWCSSRNEKRLWQLKRAAEACHDYAVTYKAPFISGKDSMFNDFCGYDACGNAVQISAMPTLLISAVSVMDDVSCLVSMDFKRAGDIIYVIGETKREFGGSEYCRLRDIADSNVPRVNAGRAVLIYEKFHEAVSQGLIASAVALGKGGLAVGLARSAMAGMLGCKVNVATDKLFSESQSRFLVSVNPRYQSRFEQIFNAVLLIKIGTILHQGMFSINEEDITLQSLIKAYKRPALLNDF